MPPSDGAIKVGRSKDISAIIKTSATSGQVVTISGMGGLGKTTVLKMIRQELEAGARYLAWIDGMNGLQRGFNENLGLINSLELSRLLIQSNKELDEIRKYELIITALKNLGENCLLLIDNLNPEKDASLTFVKLLRSLLPGWRVLITSRQAIPFTETYQLSFLDDKSLRALFYGIYTIQENDKVLEDIIIRMGFHTLAVEMLAKTSQTLGLALIELQKRLHEKGLDISKKTKIGVDHSETIITNIKEYLLGIFEIAEISPPELLLLKNMSVIPVNMTELKIAAGALYVFVNFVKITEADEEEFTMSLRGLFEKGWLLQSVLKSDDGETHEHYQIHPLIAEFIKSKYPPTTRDCIGLVTLFTKLDMLRVDPADRLRYTGFKISLLDGIKEESEAIFNLQISLIGDLVLQGWSEIALTYLDAARELSNNIELTLENRINLADQEVRVYSNIEKWESSLQSCIELVRLKEEAGRITVKDYERLANSYSKSGNHKEAKNALSKAYGLYEKDPEKHPVQLANLSWLEAELIAAKENIINKESAELYIKAHKLYEENLKKDSFIMGTVRLKFAQIFYGMDPENHSIIALEYLNTSKETFQKVFGSVHPILLPIYTLAAEIRLAQLNSEPEEIGIALADLLESEKIIEQFQIKKHSQEVYEGLIQCHRLLKTGGQAILSYQEKLDKISQNQEV